VRTLAAVGRGATVLKAIRHPPGAIAIIGMACRFPEAEDPGAFWRNLRQGKESIKFFSDEELLAAGVDPELLRQPNYVKAAPVLRDVDKFDAAFFEYSPREASATDPQHRLFLEVAWEAFEEAGYHPQTCPGAVGVFAGAGGIVSSYLVAHPRHPALTGDTATLPYIGNDKDFLATKVSYKLNLTGPSVTVQTACSTSLVAVHLACQSLASGESDMMLAGAATVRVPHLSGYVAEPGNVHSADGRCRAFDARGQGVVFGSGVAAVLLRPLEDALEAGDHVHAVIKGTSVGNDGGDKASYPSPSTAGQARTMVEALARARVSPDEIDYVECHAAGTRLGDPIEVNALTEAFRSATDRRGFCAVGSVKPNIGHPEQTAGMAGMMKTVLALEHAEIPPTLHFETPNPGIDFVRSPFFVNTELCDWPANGHPRRACVNSLGIGGTNAFAVLEEAPSSAPSTADPERSHHVFTLSAKSGSALTAYINRFRDFLRDNPGVDVADLCYTSNVSRSQHAHRIAATVASVSELRIALDRAAHKGAVQGNERPRKGVAFLFTGQGTQHPGMSAGLYRAHATFRELLDRCDEAFRPHLSRPLLETIFSQDDESRALLGQMNYMQPALFALEYGLAKLWQSWGVTPSAVMGHSLGEVVAACIAGVMGFDDAVRLVAARGRLMHALPERGAMAAVFASADTVDGFLPGDGSVVVAAANAPESTVISGVREALAAVVERLTAEGIETRPLNLSNGFHSPLVEPMLDALEEAAGGITVLKPRIPLVSNVTGRLMDEAPAPRYWCEHALRTVRFADGVHALGALHCDTFIEIGPGCTLLGIASQVLSEPDLLWLPSLSNQELDWRAIMDAAGTAYAEGLPIDWDAVHRGSRRRRVPLPTYPFERKRFWVDDDRAEQRAATEALPLRVTAALRHPSSSSRVSHGDGVARLAVVPRDEIEFQLRDALPETPSMACDDRQSELLYRLQWQVRPRRAGAARSSVASGSWIVLSDSGGVGEALATALTQRGDGCHLAFSGKTFERLRSDVWRIDSSRLEHFRRLVRTICESCSAPVRGAIYLWGLDTPPLDGLAPDQLATAQSASAGGALLLGRALDEAHARGHFAGRLYAITQNAVAVSAADPPTEAVQALLWGLGRTFALERPDLWGALIDIAAGEGPAARDIDTLAADLREPDGEDQIAYRNGERFGARLVAPAPASSEGVEPVFRGDATYLITGGLGMIGLATARWLVEREGVRSIVLAGRSGPRGARAEAVESLRRLGARIQVVTADIGVPADVQRLMEAMRGLPPVRGVIHGAGILENGLVSAMDWEQFLRVTTPKVAGAWLLHCHTRDLDLDFFVMHSSLLSLIGSPGQGNYTAANAFLDALGSHRRALGLPATVINWTAWSEGGLASTAGRQIEDMWREMGLAYIAPEDGMRMFGQLMRPPVDQMAVGSADWPRYLRQFPRPPALFESLVREAQAPASMRHQPAVPRRGASGECVSGQGSALLEQVRQHVSEQMGFDELIDADRPLRELGLDSLMAVTIASRLSEALDLPVPVVKLIGGPSIKHLVDDLSSGVVSSESIPRLAASAVASAPRQIGTSRTEADGWLVFPRPNPSAKLRLFCFPYAGGNAATYRPWGDWLRDNVELVAIEPPGRADRIHEPVIDNLDDFFSALLPAMMPYLDKPAAFFGHCLGALTLFEAARRLLAKGALDLRHVFVSSARPPRGLLRAGRFEEGLLARVLEMPKYDPFLPQYAQDDEVFTEVIRHFNIGLSEDFLASAELQQLLMPAIRAEFRMAARYRYQPEPPWNTPITCFAGLDDPYATREDALGWSEHTRNAFTLHLCEGSHFLVVDDREFIVDTINRVLDQTEFSAAQTQEQAPCPS